MNTTASVFIVLLCSLLLLRCTGVTGSRWTDEMMAEGKSEDSKDLLMVLQNILKKLQSKSLVSLNRRQSHLPPCDIGASCSVKKGPHFGELCECQRRSRCNFFFLKCL
ncbi:Cocaine- and amphetamine-regulated transcript protein CART(1-39) CART(42-89) Precursor [Channa argus]|uniref:Cocaine-and amphetamine-regulated transcript protein CART(1-39) CART(42-89) n=1 Tax=Channa argus TaxID=215402 RepID=A0A6G1PQJ2_CHAAH|nr:Cocaine- and amphetamine-regulated transcript protein CART(1-39) CART(42-89) Precursor [Channa argus]